QRNGATRLGARQGAACLPGAMNVSADVQRPVLDGVCRNAGRRILADDGTVAPVAYATPPNYPGSGSHSSVQAAGISITSTDPPGIEASVPGYSETCSVFGPRPGLRICPSRRCWAGPGYLS